jgi:hypothetical protein
MVLGAILLISALATFLADPVEPPPDCPPDTECGGPPAAGGVEPTPVSTARTGVPASPAASPAATAPAASAPAASAPAATVPPGTVGIRAGTPFTNRELGFEFEYSDWWAVDTSNTDSSEVDLDYQGTSGDGLLIVAAVPASESGAQAYADKWFANLKDWAPDLKADEREKNTILGPEIGFVDGIGRTYAGSRKSPQSATTPVGISLVVASDGRITTAVVLIVWNPDKVVGERWLQYNIRSRAELIVKTFRWGPPS